PVAPSPWSPRLLWPSAFCLLDQGCHTTVEAIQPDAEECRGDEPDAKIVRRDVVDPIAQIVEADCRGGDQQAGSDAAVTPPEYPAAGKGEQSQTIGEVVPEKGCRL